MLSRAAFFAVIALAVLMPAASSASDRPESAANSAGTSARVSMSSGFSPDLLARDPNLSGSLDAAIITPYRYAEVACEVQGLLDPFDFEPGDWVRQDQIVAEVSRRRYELMAEKAQEKVRADELALKRSSDQVQLVRELMTEAAATRQELLRAETDRELADSRLRQSKKDLDLARLNLNACRIKAPFTGYIAEIYKRPYEAVGGVEKLFRLVDSTKVYAVANVDSTLLPAFRKGSAAVFSDSSGRAFAGRVERIGPETDVKSGTCKIFVLIDNPKAELGVGMTGSLKPESPVSQ